MAKEYGQRPSSLLIGRLGDLALDLDVYRIGAAIDGVEQKDRALMLRKLQREAAVERRKAEKDGA